MTTSGDSCLFYCIDVCIMGERSVLPIKVIRWRIHLYNGHLVSLDYHDFLRTSHYLLDSFLLNRNQTPPFHDFFYTCLFTGAHSYERVCAEKGKRNKKQHENVSVHRCRNFLTLDPLLSFLLSFPLPPYPALRLT